MLGELGKEFGDLGLELSDALGVSLLDGGWYIHMLDTGKHLFVGAGRVDKQSASNGGSPERAVFARLPGDVLRVSYHFVLYLD